jgi:probable aminopeptidase NPEPL1
MFRVSAGLNTLVKVQNNNCQVVLIGRSKLLKGLKYEDALASKLGIDQKVFDAAIEQIEPNATSNIPLHLNAAKIISVQDEVGRHNTPSNANAIFKELKGLSVQKNTKVLSIVLYTEFSHALAGVAAIAKCFPIYSRKTADKSLLEEISVELVLSDDKQTPTLEAKDIQLLQSLGDSIRTCSRLIDTPSNELHTDAFTDEACALVDELGVEIKKTIIKGNDLERQGFGGIYHVGKAAAHPPVFACFSYTPPKATSSVALVGKGITFDTGGMQIKGKQTMPSMKIDMGGAAVCLASFLTLVKAGFRENLHCLLCIAENSVSPEANKPDDIITLLSGKTVEITNTDAEGRLVLADGVFYAKNTLNAQEIIDVATLTGAQSFATGLIHSAILTNDEEFENECIIAGKRSGDLVHPLPYAPELHFSDLKSAVADMTNSNFGKKYGPPSAIAGLFIGKQIDFADVKWLHVDLAGPTWDGQRATGYGPALLVTLLSKYTDAKVASSP